MNLAGFIDIDVENKDALSEFMDINALAHETIFTSILEAGVVVDHYPLTTDGKMNFDWLLTHATEHRAFSEVLGLNNAPDLDAVDPDDKAQMADWFNDHALHHQLVDEALGLT